MGQRASDNLKSKTILLSEWIEAIEDNNHSLFPNVNPYRKRLLINRNTQQLIEQYELQFLNQQDFNRYKDQFSERCEQDKVEKKIEMMSEGLHETMKDSPYIYKIRYFTDTSIEQLCSTIYNGLLYVDKVDLRLKQINDIPFLDQLYLYQACLQGFKILYEKVGFFDITQEMIFFNQDGAVKVWMNPNLSKHQPLYLSEESRGLFNSNEAQGSQSQMLSTLINLIQDNTDSHMIGNIPYFVDYLKERGLIDRLSFYKAIDEFRQYCEQNRLTRNRCMKSIYELYHAQDGALFRSQVQRSQVKRVGGRREYESLGNSQFQHRSLNGQSHIRDKGVIDTKFVKKKLTGRKVSKNSVLVQTNPSNNTNNYTQPYQRIINNSSGQKRRSQINNSGNQYSYATAEEKQVIVNERVSNAVPANLKNDNSYQTLPSKKTIHVFGSQLQQNLRPVPSVTIYRSLQKNPSGLPFSLNANRPITFSYAGQALSLPPRPPQPPQPTLNSNIQQQSYRQSLIDKLTPPAMKTVVSIGSDRSHQAVQTQKPIAVNKSEPKVTYYTNNAAYTLDSEIAGDMELYLGVNPYLI